MDKCSLNKIMFSFEYSVNSNYSIDFITKKSKSKCNDIIFELFKKLENISSMRFIDFQNMPKESGYEMIPIYELNFNIKADMMYNLGLSNDSKIIVFRFNKNKCRLLLCKSICCSNLLYVIGYDWNFSAYKH